MKNLTKQLNENIKRVMSLKEGEGSVPMVYNFIAKVTGSGKELQSKTANGIDGVSCKLTVNDVKTNGSESTVEGRFASSYPVESFLAKSKIVEVLGNISGVTDVEIEKLEMVY